MDIPSKTSIPNIFQLIHWINLKPVWCTIVQSTIIFLSLRQSDATKALIGYRDPFTSNYHGSKLRIIFNYLYQFQIAKVVIMYECSYCGLSLTRWGNYLEHVGAVHEGGKGMTKFKCRKCQKIFLKQNNFQAHCENQNPRPCVKCDVVCCTRKQLEIHRRRVHPSFQCLKCKKYFPLKASLEKT